MIMGKFFFISLFTLSLSTFAIASDEQLVDPLPNLSISKSEVQKSLENLKNSGKISAADYEVAQKELSTMSDSQLNTIKEKAVGLIRNDPDKALEIAKAPKIDLEEAHKQLNAVQAPK
jgi:hypothetical protein